MNEDLPDVPDNVIPFPASTLAPACPDCGGDVRQLPADRPLPPGVIARGYVGPVYECISCGKEWTAEEVRP
ncbi:MAG TPA: hypothetical protein VFG59_05405 [Anaeromyxobacter sp.]|nr:hypothetical protein [Anaeromyxobacter sp.]